MIQKLTIKNYALIERTEVSFDQGFTVITGETGAGKSIMLEALGLLLGARANFGSIRKGEEKCSVEALFEYNKSKIDAILQREGLDIMSDLIIRRELTSSGRSRAFINDSPVNNSLLKEIGALLIDLHGQQENSSLHTPAYQTRQLDLFAGLLPKMEEYGQKYRAYKSAQKQYEELQAAAAQVRKDEDYFKFQFEELSQLDLDLEKYEGLEDEVKQLEHAEDIQRAVSTAVSALDSDQEGAINALRAASNELKSVAAFSAELKDLFERLQSSLIELEDLSSELGRMDGTIEYNPNRLEEIRDQLDEYNRLFHKHGVTEMSDLIEVRNDYELKLQGIESFEDQLIELDAKASKYYQEALAIAKDLTAARLKAKGKFEKDLLSQVHQLGMPKAHFEINISKSEQLTSLGDSEVKMLFNANAKDDLKPINEVASGGEVSRLMLGLKSILSQAEETPTMIFDEIDTGVSGEVAKRIGALMKNISSRTQILAVTHLPGVAAKGHSHIKIAKSEKNGKVVSELIQLDNQKRVEELAAMFTGDELTEASLESARLLLKDAD